MLGIECTSFGMFSGVVYATIYIDSDGNIGSGDGLVPSGSKPLPEPMLNLIYVAIWYH